VQRAVAREMKRAPPSPNAIKAMVKKCRDEGGVQNVNKGRSGRKRSVRTAANKEQVQTAMENSPMRSLRKQHQALNISYGSLWRIARQELKKFPYRIQVKQPLSDQDKARPVNMCDWFHEAMAGGRRNATGCAAAISKPSTEKCASRPESAPFPLKLS